MPYEQYRSLSDICGDTGKTVFLDAGHGGLDPGGVGYTSNGTQVREGPVNLPVGARQPPHRTE